MTTLKMIREFRWVDKNLVPNMEGHHFELKERKSDDTKLFLTQEKLKSNGKSI